MALINDKKTIQQIDGGGSTQSKNAYGFFNTTYRPVQTGSTVVDSDTSLYIYSFNLKEQLNFKLVPQSVSTSYGPRYVKQQPFASLRPLNFYVGGTGRTLEFTIELHEQDQATVKAGQSIYDVISTLKKFSEATTGNIKVEDPVVYLQLGSHFAGKGHLNTSVEYRLPIREGRYQHAIVGFSFTYHEEFSETTMYIPDLQTTQVDFGEVVISADGNYKAVSYEPINAFFKGEVTETVNFVDYIVKSIYEDDKITNILNIIDAPPEHAVTPYEQTRQKVIKTFQEDGFSSITPSVAELGVDELYFMYAQARMNLAVVIEMIQFYLSADFTRAYRISQLTIIANRLQALRVEVDSAMKEVEYRAQFDIWQFTEAVRADGIKCLEDIDHVIMLVRSLISTLTNISGAGL